MRISRPCYDKYHRCPGWAGGGMKYAKVPRCNGGSLATVIDYDGAWRWKFHQCPRCDVWVLPYYFCHLDPTHWKWTIKFWWRYRD